MIALSLDLSVFNRIVMNKAICFSLIADRNVVFADLRKIDADAVTGSVGHHPRVGGIRVEALALA